MGDVATWDDVGQKYVPKSVRVMKAKEAKMLEAAKAKYAQAKLDRERVYDNLDTIKACLRMISVR